MTTTTKILNNSNPTATAAYSATAGLGLFLMVGGGELFLDIANALSEGIRRKYFPNQTQTQQVPIPTPIVVQPQVVTPQPGMPFTVQIQIPQQLMTTPQTTQTVTPITQEPFMHKLFKACKDLTKRKNKTRNSIHLFETEKGIKVTFIVEDKEGFNFNDIYYLFRADGIPSVWGNLIPNKEVRLMGRLKQYGPQEINTWVMVYPDLFPELPEKYTKETYQQKYDGAASHYEAVKDGFVKPSEWVDERYTTLKKRIEEVTKLPYVALITDDVVISTSYVNPFQDRDLPEEERIEVVREFLEALTSNTPIMKGDVEVFNLADFNIFFHEDSKYPNGMFSSALTECNDGVIRTMPVDF